MFDIAQVAKRTLPMKIGDLYLEVEPPKLKTLRKLLNLVGGTSGDEADGMKQAETMITCTSEILQKNRQGVAVSPELVEESLDIDQMQAIITAYFEWINGIQNEKN